MITPNTLAQDELPQLVLCVPGRWTDQRELAQEIVAKSGGFLFAGRFMMEIATSRSVELDVQPPDPRLAEAFGIAGGGRLSGEALQAIESHTFVPYLVGHGGSPELALEMMRFAAALLKAGGIAVKVESAGIARPAELWMDLASKGDHYSLHQAHTVFINEPDGVVSCGMHCLGYRDVRVLESNQDEAMTIAETFLRYVCTESPTIVDGQTFSVAADAPVYRIQLTPCGTYPPGDLFHNPFGMWSLRRAR